MPAHHHCPARCGWPQLLDLVPPYEIQGNSPISFCRSYAIPAFPSHYIFPVLPDFMFGLTRRPDLVNLMENIRDPAKL